MSENPRTGREQPTPSVPVVDDSQPATHVDRFTVGLAQKRAQHELRLAIDAALSPLDINTSQVWLLSTIERHPGASSVRLAHLVFLTPQSLGQQLMQMQRRGFIERIPGDRRRLRHYLTDAGRRICEDGLARIREVDEEVFRGFSEEDLANLAAIYRLIESSFRGARAGKAPVPHRRIAARPALGAEDKETSCGDADRWRPRERARCRAPSHRLPFCLRLLHPGGLQRGANVSGGHRGRPHPYACCVEERVGDGRGYRHRRGSPAPLACMSG